MASALAIVASVLSLTAYAWYDKDLFRGTIRPNLSSWVVWSFVTVLNFTSYFFVTSGDVVKSLFAISNSIACVLTLCFILWRGASSRVTRFDMIAAGVGVTAGMIWYLSWSAAWGNIVLQIAIAVGCIPTYRSVLDNPSHERPGPWLLWGFSFILAAGVIVLRWTGHPLELAYPVVGMVLYSGIGILALRKKEAVWLGSLRRSS